MAVGRSQLSQSFLVKMLHQILPIGTRWFINMIRSSTQLTAPLVENTMKHTTIFFSVTIPVVWVGNLNLKLHWSSSLMNPTVVISFKIF
jgi:hypothetical protein